MQIDSKEVNVRLTVTDDTQAALGNAKDSFGKFGEMVRSLVGIATLKKIGRYTSEAVQMALDEEKSQRGFEHFLGSKEAAGAHISGLEKIASKGVFSEDDIKSASINLLRESGGKLGTIEQMNLIGDAAARVGADITVVAGAIADFHRQLSIGDTIARTGKQLVDLGIISGETLAEMKKIEKDSPAKVFDELTKSISLSKGKMDELSKTTGGQVGSISHGVKELKETIGGNFAWFYGDLFTKMGVPKLLEKVNNTLSGKTSESTGKIETYDAFGNAKFSMKGKEKIIYSPTNIGSNFKANPFSGTALGESSAYYNMAEDNKSNEVVLDSTAISILKDVAKNTADMVME